MGLTLGLGLVLAREGQMYHLRRFIASAEPAGARDLSDTTGLSEVFCIFAGPGNSENPPGVLRGILAALGDGCEL
jgi:hypothetical protein